MLKDNNLILIEKHLLLKDNSSLHHQTDSMPQKLLSKLSNLSQPTYITLMSHEYAILLNSLIAFFNEHGNDDRMKAFLINYIMTGLNDKEKLERAFDIFILGIFLLDVFCQANYTGPELSTVESNFFEMAASDNGSLHSLGLRLLECDGVYAFPICQLPQALFLSRIILSTLIEPDALNWQEGICLDTEGSVVRRVNEGPNLNSIEMKKVTSCFQSLSWWNARAAVIHARLLQDVSWTELPSLWYECKGLFEDAISKYGNVDTSDVLSAQVWLEWGLCMHHFDHGDKVPPCRVDESQFLYLNGILQGKACFKRAQQGAGLKVMFVLPQAYKHTLACHIWNAIFMLCSWS